MVKNQRVYLAVDLGASGGRVMAGKFDGNRLSISEVSRFPNGPSGFGGHLHWDVLTLWKNIQNGLREASVRYGDSIASVGVDTWGVDFALLGRNDELLGNPYHYRDPKNQGMIEAAFQTVSREEIFAETGLQFMELNTLYQLLAMRRANSSLLESAHSFLMMPDLFHFLLTGVKSNEFTNATTTQFFNPKTKQWSRSLLDRFEIPHTMLQEIVYPGTNLGQLSGSVAEATGLTNVIVVLPGTHDTASAVLAVPADGPVRDRPNWAYISSGTWSLLGAEVVSPVITKTCQDYNFTNEGGIGGSIRLLKNITGLWLLQECRRVWSEQGHDRSWDEFMALAEVAEPLRSFINPDAAEFVAPADMPAAIREFCRRTGQPVPATEGAVIRCALESLALRCRLVLEMLETVADTKINQIHIVGGGSQNRLLCQMTADACDCPVLAGPVEATAIGNVMMQAIACGDVASVPSARRIIRESFGIERYDPKTPDRWRESFEVIKRLTSTTSRLPVSVST